MWPLPEKAKDVNDIEYQVRSGFRIAVSVIILLPSLIIVLTILTSKKLRIADNILVAHLTFMDFTYAVLIMKSILYNPRSIFSFEKLDVQIAGGMNFISYMSWLLTATCISFSKYYTVVLGKKLGWKALVGLLCLVWTIIVSLTVWVDLVDAYSLTPSGYTFLAIESYTPTKNILAIAIFLVFIVPVLLSGYFYFRIYRTFSTSIRRTERTMWHSNDPNFIRQHELMERQLWKVALKSSAYIIIVSVSMLPIGVSFLLEGMFDVRRSAWVDCILLCMLESYKLFSSIITLKIHKPIQDELLRKTGLRAVFNLIKRKPKAEQVCEISNQPMIDYNYQA